MHVRKHTKSILSVLLICGLLVVSVNSRVDAVGPVLVAPALTPAVKYAIGAGIVACGLYAANSDSLSYVVNDYWNKASDYVRQQWQSAVTYGTGIGVIVLNKPLLSSINNYLDSTYNPGENTIHINIGDIPYSDELNKKVIYTEIGNIKAVRSGNEVRLYQDGSLVKSDMGNSLPLWNASNNESNWTLYFAGINSKGMAVWRVLYELNYDANTDGLFGRYTGSMGSWFVKMNDWTIKEASVIGEAIGDLSGFGNATEGRQDVKVPCPPVPAAEWPDSWLDNLEEELNLAGNPTLDDETSIEEWEEEWEWYLDENGNIYKVKKGQPPRKPDDEPLRIPGPPLPDPPLPEPGVPEDYPTEDDPDITIEHHPPQTTVTEHPDGSRTEVTTQTSTITKRWWDPASKRWRTTTEETTTTTTIDYAPDGTEIGRTTTTTTQPKGEREETPPRDDTAINWEPLRRGLYELTEKFPFCLPWDLMRGIQSLESNQWDRQIRINVGDGIWPEMVIDLTMFDEIARITRVVLLVIFDLGLIFATRRLMGGDV